MSMISWQDFSNEMDDILSSGNSAEINGFHKEQLQELVGKVHKNDVLTFLNQYYGKTDPTELLEGELDYIAELTELKSSFHIIFS